MSEGRLWRQHDTGFSNNPDVQLLANLKAEAIFIRAIDYVRRLGEIEQFKGCPDGTFSFEGLSRDIGKIAADDEIHELLAHLCETGFIAELGEIEAIKDSAWVISNYTKWNPSRVDLRTARVRTKAGSILGTHRRYHVKTAGFLLPPAPTLPLGQDPLDCGVDCVGCLIHMVHHKKKDIHKCSECADAGMTDVIASYLDASTQANLAEQPAPPLPLGDCPPHAKGKKRRVEESREEILKAAASTVNQKGNGSKPSGGGSEKEANAEETTEPNNALTALNKAFQQLGYADPPTPNNGEIELVNRALEKGWQQQNIIDAASRAATSGADNPRRWLIRPLEDMANKPPAHHQTDRRTRTTTMFRPEDHPHPDDLKETTP